MTFSTPPLHVQTLGCRLNAGEADVMRRHAASVGLDDTVIVNTCAVTAEAVRQSDQQIRRLARTRPQARLIVTGCAAQIDPRRYEAMAEVDHVVGNAEKMQPEVWRALAGDETRRVMVGDIMDAAAGTAGADADAPTSIPRAFVQIQNGCDHRCTFCVIPFGRGRSRSVPIEEVVARIEAHIGRGVSEIVLTGVDITSWGQDLRGQPALGRLVGTILHSCSGLARLRLSSIDQSEADPELFEVIAGEPRLMPHLHLSLQSGADLILKRMKRRHSRQDAIAFCSRLRAARPDVALGADLIAGFPTETEAHFRDTLSIVEACGLSFLHVFPYSIRRDTPAARMPQLPGAVVKERAARLREKGRGVLEAWFKSLEGRRIDVALERAGGGTVPARSPQFAQVMVAGVADEKAAGDVVTVRITGQDAGYGGQGMGRLLAEAVR